MWTGAELNPLLVVCRTTGTLCVQNDMASRILASSKDAGVKVEFVDSALLRSGHAAERADADVLAEVTHERTSLSVFTSVDDAVKWAIPYSQVCPRRTGGVRVVRAVVPTFTGG